MGCKVIKVKTLSEEEALILFLNKVRPNIVQSPTIMPTLKLVVKECASLPLTIVVVAGTIKGEDNPHIWKNALKELKERIRKVEGVEAEVIERLKFSFDHLKDGKVRDCFLYCALYPEDFEIDKALLIDVRSEGDTCRLLPKLVHLQHLSFDVKNKIVSLKAEEMEPLKKLECFKGHFEDINEFNKFISSMQQKCHYLRSFVDDDNSSFKNAIDLRICRIRFCEGIEFVVSLSSFASPSSHPFQSLEVLDLQFLPKLSVLIIKYEGICLATTSTLAPSATFSHFKKISIRRCSSMKTLLPHWLLPYLQNLEEISVLYCDELVEIVGAATSEVEEKGSDALIKFHLPKLRELRLYRLLELKSNYSRSGVMVCDSPQLIYVKNCDILHLFPMLTMGNNIHMLHLLKHRMVGIVGVG
ncbi:uncharacterized protein [Gossypium hirsutum]|uniref:Disease resistance protein At4g27190-like leucine-rich repeats domain-containing protein n=1 Tax=Gossypium hirsutum TaxID=3635 RepID=A0ABM3A1H9_GOSHI|nr:uncharacterized protein LOC121217279 [Gossypium hirsutum]